MGRLKTSKAGKLYREMVNSPQTMQFYCDVINICRKERVKSFDSAILSVEIDLFTPDNRKRDIDNPCKLILDSLVKGGCFNDDSQVYRLLVRKCGIIAHGQIIVRISPHEPPATERP